MEQGSNIKDHDEGFLKDKDHDRGYSGSRVEQWPQWFSNKYHTKNLCFVTFCYGRTGQKMNKLFNVNSPDLVVFHYVLMVLWKNNISVTTSSFFMRNGGLKVKPKDGNLWEILLNQLLIGHSFKSNILHIKSKRNGW